MGEEDWDQLYSVRFADRDIWIVEQLSEEDYFDSVSEGIRTSLDIQSGELAEIDPGMSERIKELKETYDRISKPLLSRKVVDFFFDLDYISQEFHRIAEDKNLVELKQELESYREKYFVEEDIRSYRDLDQDTRKLFVADTGDLVLDLLETQNYVETVEGERPVPLLNDFLEEYFEESHMEEPVDSQPYLKFKL